MTRGDLSPEVQARIDSLLPDPMRRGDDILSLSPDMISAAFDPDSDVPIASVCLLDALRTMSAARYALFESHAHGIYYREVASPPQEMMAVWFEQFYVQDAAHRLYGAAEDIAEALIMMLEVSPARLQKFKGRAVSQQAAVGRLLLEDHPALAITGSIKALTESTAWTATMSYRGRLVHEQPPLVGGLGIVQSRQRRWRKTDNGGRYLAFGGGDLPEFDTATLITTCRDALEALLTAWDDSLHAFMEVLREKGGIVLENGTLHIPDYFRDKLRSKPLRQSVARSEEVPPTAPVRP
ncbi:MAG: hypothetical protein ACREM3_09570 [Candidatus Rokuibacteriota bacterium]